MLILAQLPSVSVSKLKHLQKKKKKKTKYSEMYVSVFDKSIHFYRSL